VVATRPGRGGDGDATCATPRTLHLRLMNVAGGPDDSLAAARLEAGAIWADADLALEWSERGRAVDPTDGPTLTVILRDVLPRQRATLPRPGRPSGDALAWALFEGDEPTGIIEVSLGAVAGLVMQESVAGKRMVDLPQTWRQRLLGRALGRVIAHEIGHWLWGAAHTREGLMRAGVSGSALVATRPPLLPDVSIGEAARRRLLGGAGCSPPPSPN
jgi:hypothetical protein